MSDGDWCRERLSAASCPVEGCHYCCVARREHSQLWCPGTRFHGYEEPSREQIHERMWRHRRP